MKPASSQLPSPTTTFVGRQDDFRAIGSWFANGHRLVVIVGPPGMGKTRLAIEYADSVARRAKGGRAVQFCDLTEARDLDELCARVAAQLGLSLEPGADVAASVGLALRESDDLLVLDNFEQLVDAGATTVARWLARAPKTHLLVTSRERLRIDGEVVHELEPLSLPSAEASGSEAMELFVDRARLLRRDFALTAAEAPVVAEIVRHLDGIPLAIEVAAARMDVLGPATLVERLPRRLDLLASGRRDATARQATLRGAIDGSWHALAPFAQTALAQASVFSGGFTLDAAESVLDLSAHPGAPAVVDVLATLRTKSLLRAQGAVERPGALRFSLYESIRDYASEELVASGDAVATRQRHTRYFVAMFATDTRRRAGKASSLRNLAAERENLIAVLEDALAAAPTPVSTRVAADVLLALDPVWPRSGPSDTQLAWLDAVLARPPEMLEAAPRASTLLARGRALLARGRFEESLTNFTVVLPAARELHDPRLEARALLGIGIANHRRGRHGEAKAPFERALQLLHGHDLRRESVVLGYLGAIEQEEGRLPAARAHYRKALRAAEASGLKNRAFLESTVRLRLAALDVDEGKPADAELESERAMALAVRAQSRRLQGLAEGCLALAAWPLGRLDDADEHAARSVRWLAEAGDEANQGFALAIRGAILAARDRVEESAAAFACAETAIEGVGDLVGLAMLAIHRGHLELARGRQAAAGGDVPRALAHRSEAERRLTQDRVPAGRASPARVALRMLRRSLDDAAPNEQASKNEQALLLDHDRRCIRVPGRLRWVRFGRQTLLWRLLVELCEAQMRAPGKPVVADALVAAGWPGQSLLPAAAQNRLHVAVNALRKLGLRRLIVTRDEGYLLTPSVHVRWVVNS